MGRNTEDGLEQTKVLATEAFSNGSSEDNDETMEIDMCFLTTYRATPKGQHIERRLNQLNWL